MRAAIVGGIIAIITLAAYGIVQAGRWAPAALQARVETPAPVAVEPAPAVVAEAATTAPAEPAETAAADSADAPVEVAASAPADTAEAAPSDAAAPSSDTIADAAVPAVASPPVAPAAAAPPVAAPAIAAAAAPVAPPAAAAPAVAAAAPVAPVAAPVVAAAAPPAPAAAAPAPAPVSKPIVVAQYQPAPIAPTIRPAGANPAAAPPAAAAAPVVAPQPVAAPAPAPAPLKAPDIVCNNPNAMKVSRVVEIDTTGGPGFGSQHFKTMDFLRDHEVVLTFDDGPWLNNTPAVLKALADQCLRATFFNIGKHASYYPEILKQVLAGGHTVGTHTWSHADLSKAKTPDDAKEEIEKGFSAVHYYARAPARSLRSSASRTCAIHRRC